MTARAMAHTSRRWGRIVVGGFLAELLLILAVVPLQAAGGWLALHSA